MLMRCDAFAMAMLMPPYLRCYFAITLPPLYMPPPHAMPCCHDAICYYCCYFFALIIYAPPRCCCRVMTQLRCFHAFAAFAFAALSRFSLPLRHYADALRC